LQWLEESRVRFFFEGDSARHALPSVLPESPAFFRPSRDFVFRAIVPSHEWLGYSHHWPPDRSEGHSHFQTPQKVGFLPILIFRMTQKSAGGPFGFWEWAKSDVFGRSNSGNGQKVGFSVVLISSTTKKSSFWAFGFSE
jgi:hypothetical protein